MTGRWHKRFGETGWQGAVAACRLRARSFRRVLVSVPVSLPLQAGLGVLMCASGVPGFAVIAMIAAMVLVAPGYAHAQQVTCPVGDVTVHDASGAMVTINGEHIFCGQFNRRGHLGGFHARPGGQNPANAGISAVVVTDPANAAGIYSVRFEKDGATKALSTMFPDDCSMETVLQSVAFAHLHPQSCPFGAPGWAKCGPNAPPSGGAQYCHGPDGGTGFFIAFATLDDGRINTAFPLRQ